MATISLYANKLNNMPELIHEVKSSVTSYKLALIDLKAKSLQVNKSICDLDDVINTISTSTQIQDDKVESLETFYENSEQFIADVVRIDGDVADTVNQNKDDFYDEYYYLKPECEKSGWEKFCDGCKKVGQWCKDNWKSIVKIIASVVIIAALGIASILTGGALAVILAGAFWGALIGGALGGIMGGITSVISGGSFLEGFADGMLSGTISGAITGAASAGLGLAGQAVGKGISCASKLGKAIKITSKVTNVLSDFMDGFDTLTMAISLFDPDNPLVKFNNMLQSSVAYNIFKEGVGLLATFTGGATSTMKCFVAGTMILTAGGLVAIENIKAGDKVISTNPETFEVAEKAVVETYVRETTELVHLKINGEIIKTTPDHPFYVKDVGFVGAGDLYIGDKLLDSKGNILLVEDMKLETTEIPTPVYNFQVEDFHTYHVGENNIWVHNANCVIEFDNKSGLDTEEFEKQLKDQQTGLGDLTIDEYLSNREAYNRRKRETGSGRAPESDQYQKNARAVAITKKANELLDSGKAKDLKEARKMAKDWAKDKAALHGPDQIAGGYANNILPDLGDSRINSSIGSQWKNSSRIGALDEYINQQSQTLPGTTKLSELNISLVLKKG